jgi:hypothetical protein
MTDKPKRGRPKKQIVVKPTWFIPFRPQLEYGFGEMGLGIYVRNEGRVIQFIKEDK